MAKKLTKLKTIGKIVLSISPLLVGLIIQGFITRNIKDNIGPLYSCCAMDLQISDKAQKIFIISEFIISTSVFISCIFAIKFAIKKARLAKKFKPFWIGLSTMTILFCLESLIWVLNWYIAFPQAPNTTQFIHAFFFPADYANHLLLFNSKWITFGQDFFFIPYIIEATTAGTISWPITKIIKYIKPKKHLNIQSSANHPETDH